MRAAVVVLSLSLVPVLADADPGTAPVIGGTDAPAGKWPDVAGVYFGGSTPECTGTLIAPTVVLTAGHCAGGITSVLIGTSSLARQAEGDMVPVMQTIEYPQSETTEDIAVLILTRSSTKAPRSIATGWASLDIKNGASISIVGYGAIDKSARMYVNELKEATTTITDADCTDHPDSCNPGAQPAGELGAGGMGIDTCPGDSGGPLYLPTDYGTFLAGVTSRGYTDNVYDCSEGGLYARPDKIVRWIEEVAKVEVGRGPEPTVPRSLSGVRGHLIEAQIDANDPKSEKHIYAITAQPTYATAAIRNDGHLRVCTDPAVVAMDTLSLSVTDKNDPSRTLAYTIALQITEGNAGDGCDADDFDSGGCCDSGRSAGGSLPIGIGVLLLLRRRRR